MQSSHALRVHHTNYVVSFLDLFSIQQGLKFECGATNPVAVEECLHKHTPAMEAFPPSGKE